MISDVSVIFKLNLSGSDIVVMAMRHLADHRDTIHSLININGETFDGNQSYFYSPAHTHIKIYYQLVLSIVAFSDASCSSQTACLRVALISVSSSSGIQWIGRSRLMSTLCGRSQQQTANQRSDWLNRNRSRSRFDTWAQTERWRSVETEIPL